MERDFAHEADMERLRRQQLRDDISPEEAREECSDWDDPPAWDDERDTDSYWYPDDHF